VQVVGEEGEERSWCPVVLKSFLVNVRRYIILMLHLLAKKIFK
jgi:hypothetical protein